MKKVFSLLITLAMLVSVVVMPMSVSADTTAWDGVTVDTEWAGEGTQASPYLITSAAELAGLAKTISDAISTSTEIPVASSLNDRMYFAYSGKYFKLTTDIDLDNKEWMPIGRWGLRFDGIFDGDGHVVKNLKITTEYSALGLFGATGRNARITNIGVDGVNIQTTVGRAVDYVKDGDITKAESRVQAYGGLIGVMTTGGTADAPALEGCFARDVVIKATSGQMSHRCMGGLFGSAEYKTASTVASGHTVDQDPENKANFHYVSNCYVMNVDLTGYSNVGAFLGGNYGYLGYSYRISPKFTNCYVAGDIKIAYNTGTTANTFGNNFGFMHNPGDMTYTKCYTTTNEYVASSRDTYANKATIVSNLATEDAWSADNEKAPINNGFPVLAWENTWSDKWDGTSVDTTWAGSGTAEDPYLITSAAELYGLAKAIDVADPIALELPLSAHSGNSGYTATQQYYIYTGKYFKLTTDIDLGNNEWYPIGEAGIRFDGHFDGDNHVIKNVYMSTQATAAGLFGGVGLNATIKDLGVDGVDIRTTIGSLAHGTNAWDNYGRCAYFGGFVGITEPGGSLENPKYANCFVRNVHIQPTAVQMGIQPMGGFIGVVVAAAVASDANNNNRIFIKDCYAENVALFSHSVTGGFIGGPTGGKTPYINAINCYVGGNVRLESTTGEMAYTVKADGTKGDKILLPGSTWKSALVEGYPEGYDQIWVVRSSGTEQIYTFDTWRQSYNFSWAGPGSVTLGQMTNCFSTASKYKDVTNNSGVSYATTGVDVATIAKALVTGNNAWNLDRVENPINDGFPVLGWEKWWTTESDPLSSFKGASVTVEDGYVTDVTLVQNDSAVSGTVIVAVYNGDRFVSAATATAVNGEIDIEDMAVATGNTVKVFVWDSVTVPNPLALVYSTTIAE